MNYCTISMYDRKCDKCGQKEYEERKCIKTMMGISPEMVDDDLDYRGD